MAEFGEMFVDVKPQGDVMKAQVEKLQAIFMQLITSFEEKTGMIVYHIQLERQDTSEMGGPPSTMLTEVFVDASLTPRIPQRLSKEEEAVLVEMLDDTCNSKNAGGQQQ